MLYDIQMDSSDFELHFSNKGFISVSICKGIKKYHWESLLGADLKHVKKDTTEVEMDRRTSETRAA